MQSKQTYAQQAQVSLKTAPLKVACKKAMGNSMVTMMVVSSTCQLSFSQAINLFVQVKKKVRPVRNEQPVANLNALALQGLNLFKQGGKVDDYTVAHHTG